MNNFFKFIIALLSLALLISPSIPVEKTASAGISSIGTSQNYISKDYKTTINDVTVIVKSGTSYKNYKKIKNAINKTPKTLLEGMESIIISPEHPSISLNPNPSEIEKKSIEDNPDVGGIHEGSIIDSGNPNGEKIKKSRIALKDDTEIVGVYVHELTHHLNFMNTTNNSSLCSSKEFQTLYKSVTNKASKKEDVKNQWISKLPPEEFIAYMVEFNYTTDNKSYHKLITENYPEVGEFLDKMFANLIE